ncbi:MAG: hypothetical protein PHW60_12060 [Kiritimatiellae bacterium]|nr:hypothetical protein [Kiritimatiellia bacterium]
MTDIQVTCPACGWPYTVSEFVEESGMACPACGQATVLPERQPGKTGLKLQWRALPRPREQEVNADASGKANNAPAVPAPPARHSANTASDIHRSKVNAPKVWMSVLIFMALAGGLVYIRFFGSWPGMPLATLKGYGMLAIAAAYLFIIVLALRNNMFDGLLSIVIPLYPFYYLFVLSGAVYVRALVGALLVAFGYDSLLYLHGWAAGVSGDVNHWIQSMTAR